jgi:hypothetical protein
MDATTNPYSPGAGRKPSALVGREAQLDSWEVRLSRIGGGRDAQSAVLYGLRGVGKTVLLSEYARRAEHRGWLVAKFEMGAGKPLRESLGESLHAPLVDLARPSAGARFLKALKTALSFKASYDEAGHWTFGVDLSGADGGGADTGGLEADLLKLTRDLSAGMETTGLAILIDEAQELTTEELTAVATAAHRASQDSWRVLVVLAGLPSLPRLLAEAKSYTERLFTFDDIRHLPIDAARAALTKPAADEGVEWTDAAVDVVVEESEGYPYFLQQFGQEVWNVASTSPITEHDARLGTQRGLNVLDAGFFRARWDRATPAEKTYMKAMAEDAGTPSQSGVVATRLDRRPTSLGPTRANLINKGLIYAPEHGVVDFTVPHMAAFITRQPE